jgi:hypothetical protein
MAYILKEVACQDPAPNKARIGNHLLKPEILMLGYGYASGSGAR